MPGKPVFFIFLLILAAGMIYAADTAAAPLDFQDCLKIAKANSFTYRIQSEKVKQANLAKFSAIGGLLPSISLQHTREYGLSNSGAGQDMGWESSIVAKQPLFHGLEKLEAISYYDRLEVREELNLLSTGRQLAQDTAGAFYALASAQADMADIQEELNLINDRVKELRGWMNLGKSKPSEVYAAESVAALTASQLEDAKASAAAAADSLALVMGVDNVMIQQPGESAPSSVTIDAAVMTNSRSEVKALQAALEAQGRLIEMGAGSFLPQVDLNLSKPVGGTPYMGGTAYKDSGWQVMLTANWSLFEGGSRVFDSLAAFSAEEALKQQLQSVIADVRYEIKSRARDLAASESSVIAIKDAYDKAVKSLKAQQADYKNGLVTNVDVIQALTTAESVKQSLDRKIMQKELNKALMEISLQ